MKTLKVLLQEVVSGIKAWVNSNFAQESNTVHKTGNETVNGIKTFTSMSTYNNTCPYCKNTSISGKLTPETTTSIETVAVGNSNMWYGNQTYVLDASGECYWRLNAGSFHSTSQGQGVWGFDFGVKRDFSAVFLRPQFNNAYWLGESDHQWVAVYAKNYYYNGTAWGLDKSNTWSNENKYTSGFILSNISWSGVTPPSSAKATVIEFKNSDTRQGRYINRIGVASAETWIETIRNVDANTSHNFTVIMQVDNSGNKKLLPYNSDADLGQSTSNSTGRWKTLNGINPGALSLPGTGGYTDIKGNITDLSGGDNTFTAPYDGWVCVKSANATVIHIINTNWAVCQSATQSTAGTLCCLCPVMSGQSFKVIVNATSLEYAYIHPCKGNV